MKNTFVSSILLLALIFICCENDDSSKIKGEVVAKVGPETLYVEDVKSLIPSDISKKDSINIVENYKLKWIRDRLMIEKAKAELSSNEEIQRLVRNYKESLLLDFYTKNLLDSKLDSVITKEDYKEEYEEYKDEYLAEEPIYNVKLVILSAQHPLYSRLGSLWEEGKRSEEQLDSICDVGTTQCWLEDDIWLSFASIKNLIKTDQVKESQLEKGFEKSISEDDTEIFIYVKDIVDENEVKPLVVVKDQLKNKILNNRKEELLRSTRNKLYQKALEENSIKFNL